MFDLNPENLWMGEKPSPRKRKSPSRAYRRPKTRVVYVERRRPKTRTVYRQKQPQYSIGDYAKATVKGAKSAYGGAKATYRGAKTTYRGAKKTYGTVSKFVSKIGKKSMQDRTIREKLRGSIYKKEK